MSSRREYPVNPIVGVGIVLFHSGKVLLIRRGKPPRKGHWSIPGGKQKLGETLEEAARREVLEETGLEMGPLKLIDVVDSITFDEQDRILYHYSLVEWVGELSFGQLCPSGDATDARWFFLEELPNLGLWEKTLEIIRQAYIELS